MAMNRVQDFLAKEGAKKDAWLRKCTICSDGRRDIISFLTKIYNEISELITCGKCNVGDILLRQNKFDKAWCEFVDVHEQYLGLVQNETDKQNVCASYEEQSK